MAFNGSGVFSLVAGNPVVTGTVISSTWANNTLSDIANNGLTNCLTKDGQQTPTANIPLGGFKVTNLGNGTALTDAASLGQIQNNGVETLGSIGGTGDAIVAASTPAITAYVTGQKFLYTPTASNTVTNPTINISGVGAKTITQSNGSGLWSSALVVGTPYEIYYDGTNFRVQSGQLGSQIVQMGSPFALRNRFIDGKFDIWSTGTSFNLTAGSNSYTADMWAASPGNIAGAATISRIAFAPGSEPLSATSPLSFACRFQQTTGSTSGNPFITQKIESVATAQGRSQTLSVVAFVASGTLNVTSITIVQSFGGGGGSASVTSGATVNWNVTTTPQRFSVRLDIPSITGKTIGTTGNDSLGIAVQFPLNTTFDIRMTEFQLEDCPANAPAEGLPTPYEVRGFQVEQAMGTRYFQVIYSAARMYFPVANQFMGVNVNFGRMRAVPATSLNASGTAVNATAVTFNATNSFGGLLQINNAAIGDSQGIGFLWNCDARF